MTGRGPTFGQHLYERLVQEAADAWLERALHRLGDYGKVQEQMAADPDGPGLWLHSFAQAFMRDQGMDGADGHLWVLAHTYTREVPDTAWASRQVTQAVAGLARSCFALDVLSRARRDLERKSAFGW